MTRDKSEPTSILTAAQVKQAHDGLGGLLVLLPELGFTRDVKAALSGHLFKEGPRLAVLVHDALCYLSEPSGDRQAVGQAIYDRLQRAQALRDLQFLLSTAARRAGDLAMYDQSVAVKEAVEAVQQARHDEKMRWPRSGLLLHLLGPALRLLEKRQARATQGVRRAHRLRAENA